MEPSVSAKGLTFQKERGRRNAPKREACITCVACDDAFESAMCRGGLSLGIREPPFVGEQVLRLMQPQAHKEVEKRRKGVGNERTSRRLSVSLN